MDLLMRDGAPLSEEQWAAVDKLVVDVARKYLVGRRFLPLLGPLGTGMPVVPLTGLCGCEPGEVITSGEPQLVKLCTLSQDFSLTFRGLEMAGRLELPLDLSAAAAAAQMVAQQEDALVFQGCAECGFPGLLTAKGLQKVKGSSWATEGTLFADVVKGVEVLAVAGFPGPYAVVLSPASYTQAHRPMGQGPRLEIELLKQVAGAGVFAAPGLTNKQALVLEANAQNLDLAVGADLKVAYLGNEGLDHLFRVMETAAVRVKRPESLVLITGA